MPDEVLTYKHVDGYALKLDVFRGVRPNLGTSGGALLLFHGGAWTHGNRAQFHPQCRHFSRQGLTCIAAEYRVRSRHGTTPADALQDARDAMRFVRQHAAELSVDPARIAAGGGSAGGHLAAAMGAGVPLPDPREDPALPIRPDALVLFNPMLDLSPGKPDHALVGPTWALISPRQHVRPGMPPTLILNGTADPEVPVDTVLDFCRAIRRAGGECQIEWFEGAGHGFFNPTAEGGRHHASANVAVERFLRGLAFL